MGITLYAWFNGNVNDVIFSNNHAFVVVYCENAALKTAVV